MIEMMESEMVGEKVIANGENLSYRKVFELIADSMDKKRPSIALSPMLGKLAWRVEWLRSKITGSAALVTKETVENSRPSNRRLEKLVSCFWKTSKRRKYQPICLLIS